MFIQKHINTQVLFLLLMKLVNIMFRLILYVSSNDFIYYVLFVLIVVLIALSYFHRRFNNNFNFVYRKTTFSSLLKRTPQLVGRIKF